jgi:hypothetical protein
MADIILTEAEFTAIKTAIEEAQATRSYFNWLAGTARRINREDILQPKLGAALDNVKAIDLENPRRLEAADADADKPRTSRSKK